MRLRASHLLSVCPVASIRTGHGFARSFSHCQTMKPDSSAPMETDWPWADIFSTPLSYRLTSTRSEEHTSELQSLMRISYAVFCLKKKKKHTQRNKNRLQTYVSVISHTTHNTHIIIPKDTNTKN